MSVNKQLDQDSLFLHQSISSTKSLVKSTKIMQKSKITIRNRFPHILSSVDEERMSPFFVPTQVAEKKMSITNDIRMLDRPVPDIMQKIERSMSMNGSSIPSPTHFNGSQNSLNTTIQNEFLQMNPVIDQYNNRDLAPK